VVRPTPDTAEAGAVVTLLLSPELPSLSITTTSSNSTFGKIHICADPHWSGSNAGFQVAAGSTSWNVLQLVSVCRKIAKDGRTVIDVFVSIVSACTVHLNWTSVFILGSVNGRTAR
jgi:hypothetical protein